MEKEKKFPQEKNLLGTILSTGSTNNKNIFTAPAKTLEQIKTELPVGEVPTGEKRGRGRPKGSTSKEKTPELLGGDITPDMIEALMGFVSYSLDKLTKSNVWNFKSPEEKVMFCSGIAKYLNIRLPNALGKFAPEITLALILTGYTIPRMKAMKVSKLEEKKASD